MKHIGALVLKFIMVSVVLTIFLLALTNLKFGSIFTISLTITVLSYFIGDLAILPRTDNTIATVADVCLSLVTLLMFNLIYTDAVIPFFTAIITSIGIGAGEWLFHKFFARSVAPVHDKGE
ncbi:MAG TPA: DUF2512 family protein [Clostridia bacterium]|nr:DUF2512 family protein [Clostridia bacterium]